MNKICSRFSIVANRLWVSHFCCLHLFQTPAKVRPPGLGCKSTPTPANLPMCLFSFHYLGLTPWKIPTSIATGGVIENPSDLVTTFISTLTLILLKTRKVRQRGKFKEVIQGKNFNLFSFMYFFFAVFGINTTTHHKILSNFFPSIQTKYLGGKLPPASLKYLLYYLYVWTQQKQEKTNVINKHQLKTFDNVTLLYQFLFYVNKHRSSFYRRAQE